MKKICVVILLSFVLFSCGTDINEVGNGKKIIKTIDYRDIIGPLDKNVKKSYEFRSCMEIASLDCAERASYKIAGKEGNTGICDKIQNKNFRDSCINNALLLIAKDKKDVSYCKKITNEIIQSNCNNSLLYIKSIDKLNPNFYCDTFGNGKIKQRCKDDFYYNMALKNENTKECLNIVNIKTKNMCIADIN